MKDDNIYCRIGFLAELHARIKQAAKDEGISFTGLIRRSVIKYLESIGK